MVTQVPTFLGLASSDIKWQFVMGTPEGTMITLTILGVQVWTGVVWREGRKKLMFDSSGRLLYFYNSSICLECKPCVIGMV